jgi:putative polyhydroxyalkanoate system protein
MKQLEVRVPHALGREAVREKLDSALVKARAEYEQQVGPIQADWETADRMRVAVTVMGMKFTGQIEVADTEVLVKLDLPAMASLFAGRIREGIEERIGGLLA